MEGGSTTGKSFDPVQYALALVLIVLVTGLLFKSAWHGAAHGPDGRWDNTRNSR